MEATANIDGETFFIYLLVERLIIGCIYYARMALGLTAPILTS